MPIKKTVLIRFDQVAVLVATLARMLVARMLSMVQIGVLVEDILQFR